MTGDQVLILVVIIAATLIIGFAVWRFRRLGVKIRVPLGEAEMVGDEPLAGADNSRSSGLAGVRVSIGGGVVDSVIDTVGGSAGPGGSAGANRGRRVVSAEVKGSVKRSRVRTLGGNDTSRG